MKLKKVIITTSGVNQLMAKFIYDIGLRLMGGVETNIPVIQELPGHKYVSTTMIYTHVLRK